MDSAVALSRATSVRLHSPTRDRRLTDQVLSAFNHAYGMGATEVAELLRQALAKAEDIGQAAGRHDRRDRSVMALADLWVAFVDARDHYNRICADGTVDKARAEAALAEMKAAYMTWSDALTHAG